MRWLILAIILSACNPMCQKRHEEMTAEEVLKKYLDIAFNMTELSQKDELISYTSGDLHESLASADADTIREAYLDKKYKVEVFSILKKEDFTPRESEITFLLKYRESSANPPDFKNAPLITNKNTVEMIREHQKWLVAQVIGSDTSFDFPLTNDDEKK